MGTPRCKGERRERPGDCQPPLCGKILGNPGIFSHGARRYASRTPRVEGRRGAIEPGRKDDMADPVVIATWPFGQTAVKTAMAILQAGKPALDAAIAGAQAVEDDPTVHSVGYGG